MCGPAIFILARVGITCEGNWRIVVIPEINNNNFLLEVTRTVTSCFLNLTSPALDTIQYDMIWSEWQMVPIYSTLIVPVWCIFSARQHAERAICYRKFVRPSVRHTGGSVKNGWTYHRNFHQAGREGGKGGKVFRGLATFGGPRRRSKILKMVFQMASFWPKICIKSIFGRGSAPDPTGGA